MPDVHTPDGFVPELQGTVRGAVTVVCHSPFDLECLYAITDLAPRPPASPLGSLAATLNQSSPIDWGGWWAHWRSEGRQIPLPDASLDASGATTPAATGDKDVDVESEADERPESDLETLKRVLAALFHIWQAQDVEDGPQLSCCVSVASEGATPNGVVWAGSQPALAFGLGSLWTAVGTATWTARGFIAGLVLGGGIDAASRSAGLVRRAREVAVARQLAKMPQPPDLPDIRTLDAIPEGQRLCVLVHGLCSTDVGTFDEFEARVRSRSGKPGNATVNVVGFPHDSLTTTIETNAQELAQHLVRLGARECRLVCHSRGGLVARRSATWLRKEGPDGTKWIHSCVTFGTPHLGTSVANSPGQLTALLMSIAHLSRSPGAQSVVDILCGVQAGRTYVGVSELVPSGADGSYLARLEQLENCLFLDDAIPLRAFGSTGRAGRSLKAWLIKRVLGTGEHDLLVPISSSVPSLRAGTVPSGRLTGRTHFEYFSRLGTREPDPVFWQEALNFMGLPTP
jgi:hypothetical protein